MFKRKKRDKVYIVREVDIDTYGSYTTFNESVTCCSTEEDAEEFIESLALVFERVCNNLSDNTCIVRLCDDPHMKVLISRSFGDCPFLNERRLFVTEREI